MTTLLNLKEGQSAHIDSMSEMRDDVHFFEMGFAVGSIVKLIRKAPFGGPLYLEINGNYLCIRQENAAQIVVDVK